MRGAALPLSHAVRSGTLPGPGRHGPAGQWNLHGHEESASGRARTLPPAPPHGHPLQPTAVHGYTKVACSFTQPDLRGESPQCFKHRSFGEGCTFSQEMCAGFARSCGSQPEVGAALWGQGGLEIVEGNRTDILLLHYFIHSFTFF